MLPPPRIDVLLVDDQPLVAEAVRRMLEKDQSVNLVYCQNPHQAIGTAKLMKPTVILQDLVMPGVDNWAHAGGFAGGYGAARALDPLKPERIQHLAWALVSLALTAVSVALSAVLGGRLLATAGG